MSARRQPKSEFWSYLDVIVGNVEPVAVAHSPEALPTDALAVPVGKRSQGRSARTSEEDLAHWQAMRTRVKNARFVVVLLLAVLAFRLVSVLLPGEGATPRVWTQFGLLLLALGGLVAGALYWFGTGEIDDRIRGLRIEVEIADDVAREADAYRLFQLHQVELDRYYKHTLRNSRVMMATGLLCLAAGLVVVAGAYGLVRSAKPEESTQAWIVGALGAVGGLLTNYVAALYLKMHAAASQALNDFHNRLVSTHHLHVANFLAAKIATDATREQALKTMAEEIAKR